MRNRRAPGGDRRAPKKLQITERNWRVEDIDLDRVQVVTFSGRSTGGDQSQASKFTSSQRIAGFQA